MNYLDTSLIEINIGRYLLSANLILNVLMHDLSNNGTYLSEPVHRCLAKYSINESLW